MLAAPQALLALSLFAFQPPAAEAKAPTADVFKPDPAWKALGPNVWFDAKNRRLAVRARVVLREGPLEHLLCLKGTKEHEAILATPAPARAIHAGLLLTGAEPGHPVRFLPKFKPPVGTPIEIILEWEEQGQAKHSDARDWVFDEKAKQPLKTDWVFAGSEFLKDPAAKGGEYFAADDGDLITVANFASAILDLPIASTADDASRVFIPDTKRVPPIGTGVTMLFRPRPAEAAKPKP